MSAIIVLAQNVVPPGGVLRGTVMLVPLSGDEGRRVELSVLWETEGKGDTDQGVVLYRVLADGDPVAAAAEHAFEAPLTVLPLSYNGTLIKISWLVRVRRLVTLGSDMVIDEPFLVAWPE